MFSMYVLDIVQTTIQCCTKVIDITNMWYTVGSFSSSAVSPAKHQGMRENTRMRKLSGSSTAPDSYCHVSPPSSVGLHKPCIPSPPASSPVSSLGCWRSSGSLFALDSHRLGRHVLVEFGCQPREEISKLKTSKHFPDLFISTKCTSLAS